MSSDKQHVKRSDRVAEPEVRRSAEAAGVVPAAPVPLPTLVVGHAEDSAEADADRRADQALARLRRVAEERASQSDSASGTDYGNADPVRRAAAPSGSVVVGREGGALDASTAGAIENARGRGASLPGDVRARMETAFGTSLSGVRVHHDDGAAGLSSALSARAFTTGRDIFFGRGQYAPDTPEGEHVLAHEIAHIEQAR